MATAEQNVSRQQRERVARQAAASSVRAAQGTPPPRTPEMSQAEALALRDAGELTRTCLTPDGWLTKRA